MLTCGEHGGRFPVGGRCDACPDRPPADLPFPGTRWALDGRHEVIVTKVTSEQVFWVYARHEGFDGHRQVFAADRWREEVAAGNLKRSELDVDGRVPVGETIRVIGHDELTWVTYRGALVGVDPEALRKLIRG